MLSDTDNGGYTTTRENGELRLILSSGFLMLGYTTTREDGELRPGSLGILSLFVIPLREKMGNNDNVSAPNIPWWFHRILYPHFPLASIPQMERNVFNKNSPWKWMPPSLEFPWQDFIRMTAEMQFAFWFTKRKQFSLDIGRLRRYNIPVSETGL